MAYYRSDAVLSQHRDQVRHLLKGLETLPASSADLIVEAWSILLSNSRFDHLADVPVSPGLTHSLVDHTNDVVHLGRLIAAGFGDLGTLAFDAKVLDQILYLHDIDKLMLFQPRLGGAERSALAWQIPHGVLAGLLLNELGFCERVVSVVATHATDAPFHNECPEALILHYADLAAIDAIKLRDGQRPFFQIS